MSLRYKLWDLEVFGNDIDGFEVDSWRQVDTVELEDDIPSDQIIDKLVDGGHLSGYAHGRCEVDEQGSWIYIREMQSGRPLFNLEAIEC